MRAHQDAVLRLCASLLVDATQAEDAAQEVFLKAYRSLKDFRGASSFSTWLHRIASNHCMDLLRKRSREKAESWDALLEREGETLHALFSVADQGGPAEHSDLVDRVLACLSPDQRAVLALREAQGMTYQEIAATLDISLDAVKARLRRARADFDEKLRHFLGPGDV